MDSDRIVGLGQWPNVRADYAYGGTAGAPELVLALRLDVDSYDESAGGWQEAAANDREAFEQADFQLRPEVPGRWQTISMSLENTLLEQPETALSDAQAQQVRDFVSQCLAYVSGRERGEPGGDAPSATVTFPFATDTVASADVIPMSVGFTLTREPDGLSDSTAIDPRTSPPAPPSLDRFVAGAEAALVTSGWQLRIGTSTTAPSGGGVIRQTLWAVRMAKPGGQGLGYTIEPGPSFYAPEPLAKALRDGPVAIARYETGGGLGANTETLQFAGVDLNTWARQALSAVDAFLTPTYTAPASVVDEPRLAKILGHRDTLAAAIARTVKPVLESSKTDEPSVAAAADRLHQALRDQLGSAFAVTAVTVFGVSGAAAPGADSPPRFYGRPLADAAASLSSATIPLTAGGDSRLAFLFTSESAAGESSVRLAMTFAMSHLDDGGRWIEFASGPFPSALPPESGDAVEMPVVLRELPEPPSLTEQAAAPTYPDAGGLTPDLLARWNYAFGYVHRAAAQDTVSAVVEFDRGPAPAVAAEAAARDEAGALFDALAQFVTVQPLIAADLEEFLLPVDADSEATDEAVVNAGCALAAFETIVGAVAAAYDAWSRRVAPPAAADVARPAGVAYEFDMGLVRGPGGRARVEIHSAEGVPAPAVDLDAGLYERHSVTPDAPARAAYEYSIRGAEPVAWLAYEDALALPARTVGYGDLDVFARPDGCSTVHVERNARLGAGSPTTPPFRFRSRDVGFADRLVPLLAHAEYDLGSVAAGPAPLETYLSGFFTSLLSSAEGREVAVKMAAGYATQTPSTVLPIHLLPPTLTSSATIGPLVAAVSSAVEDWLTDNAPPEDQDAEITFALDVFATDAMEQRPLLTIGNLHVPVAKLAR